MRTALTVEYYGEFEPKLTNVHARLNTRLRADPRLKGKLPLELDARGKIVPCVSYDALHDFKQREFGAFEDYAGRKGLRRARMRFDVFKRVTYDMPAMEQIEVDHHLLDVIVVHETSGRPLGRPWLTLAIDRSTRMVVGMHVSFEVPSYASLQRCLMHAMWPKNLAGLPLNNPWPCEGIPNRLVVDNGREFYSSSLRSAELALGFTTVFMPVRTPNMKGIIERFFGTLEIGVLDFTAGKTFHDRIARGEYKSVREASITLPRLRWEILRWVVDDYHVSVHSSLDATPLERWYEKVPEDGLRSVPRQEDLLGLMGSVRSKPIGRQGVRIHGQFYFHPDLTKLRRVNGETYRYEVRCDPYDIGSIQLLTTDGKWLTLQSDRPERAKGVSVHQNRLRRSLARRLVAPGQSVLETDLDRAISLLDGANATVLTDQDAVTTAAAHARYGLDNGLFLTPVAGLTGGSTGIERSLIEMIPVTGPETKDPSASGGARVTKARKRSTASKKVVFQMENAVSDDEMEKEFRKRQSEMEKS